MIKLSSLLTEKKSVQFDIAETFAKKYKIEYKPIINRWNKLQQIVFLGSAEQFFTDKKKSKFVQVTKPTGFDKNSTSELNIGVMIPGSFKGSSIPTLYIVNPK